MLRPAVIVTKSTVFRTDQMRRNIVRCVGERSAEMPGLRVISQQDQSHAGHISNVVEQRIVRQRLLLGGGRDDVNARGHRWSQKELYHNILTIIRGNRGPAGGPRAIAFGFEIARAAASNLWFDSFAVENSQERYAFLKPQACLPAHLAHPLQDDRGIAVHALGPPLQRSRQNCGELRRLFPSHGPRRGFVIVSGTRLPHHKPRGPTRPG